MIPRFPEKGQWLRFLPCKNRCRFVPAHETQLHPCLPAGRSARKLFPDAFGKETMLSVPPIGSCKRETCARKMQGECFRKASPSRKNFSALYYHLPLNSPRVPVPQKPKICGIKIQIEKGIKKDSARFVIPKRAKGHRVPRFKGLSV